jgi:protein-S-isoprenylcysteine O-methyltransferase Ste14
MAIANHLLIFTPERWPHRELLSRATALLIVTAFLGWKAFQFDQFPQTFGSAHRFYSAITAIDGTPFYREAQIALLWSVKMAVWLVETGIYTGYIVAYLCRSRAVAVAGGFMETAFPIVVAGLPMFIAAAPYNLPDRIPFATRGHLPYFLTVMAVILAGSLINLMGLISLRRAFTIMAEARQLVRRGIFRYMRHPLYAGHFIIFGGSVLLRLHIYTVVLFLLFCFGQVWRARIEERKLIENFPEYENYRRRTGMFWPKGLFTK